MKLYFIEPEVAGGLGENTQFGNSDDVDRMGVSGKVKFLHYKFDGWLGDELLESTPCFIIASTLQEELINSGLDDFNTEECAVSKSELFDELYPNREIPSFHRFLPKGTIQVKNGYSEQWSGHHFSLSQKAELVVTEEAVLILKKFLKHVDIDELIQKA
ncbi:hypothetical protein ACSVDA_21525 [Cytobacillus sp. Hm23]